MNPRSAVWVVFREYQSNTPDILAAFDSEAEAEAYALEMRHDDHEDGENVYDYEPGEDEREETRDESDWTVTIGVQECPLHRKGEDALDEAIAANQAAIRLLDKDTQ